MDKAQIKSALIEAGAKAKQNRKEYFERKDINRHFDYRDRSLRTQARALNIALAYLNGKPFNAVEKYNYMAMTKPDNTIWSVWYERKGDQLAAFRAANEILGHQEEVVIAGRTVKRPARNEGFENWLQGIENSVVAVAAE